MTVVDETPPSVQIAIPGSGEALQDGITFQAAASDNCGVINSVFFFIREPNSSSGTPIGCENLDGSLNSATGKWEYNFNTTSLPDGYYVLLAKAIDNSGNEGWSEAVPSSIRNWAVLEMLPSTENDKAGRTMPVKFSLRIVGEVDPAMPFVYNEQLDIRIYNSSKPTSILQSSLFGDSSTDYRIDMGSEHYITNFKTDKKPAEYTVEIWRPSNNFLVGGFTFATTK